MKRRERLDKLLVIKKIAPDLETAEKLILAGKVIIPGRERLKPGISVNTSTPLELKKSESFVSRAGIKLDRALESFQVKVKDKICLDAGASTGGFTQVLLERGAKYVFAVDVGYGLLDWTLRSNPRLINLERTNIRYFGKKDLIKIIEKRFPGEKASDYFPRLISLDLSFISLGKVLPKVLEYLPGDGEIIALIKPQFELEPKKVGKGGIVREEKYRLEAVKKIETFSQNLGLISKGVIPASIPGAKGNQEYFILVKISEV